MDLLHPRRPPRITLEHYDTNLARLRANAAARGADRRSGPTREGAALLQGIIICGRCGTRMTVRYHQRGGADLPTYLCQRDGIENAQPVCTTLPGHTLDQHIGQLLIDTLTPLAIEAALHVSAELGQRAAEADALRAAHVQRAQYQADLARRIHTTATGTIWRPSTQDRCPIYPAHYTLGHLYQDRSLSQ